MPSPSIRIRLAEGREVSLPAGDPLAGVAPAGAVAAILDGREVDLACCPDADADVRFLTPADADGLHVFRHSSAHLLAAAVKDLFPEARYGIGPPIEGGFYYDFRVEEPFSREDLDRIEVRMRELVKQRIPFEREILDKDDAIRVFEEQGELFKVELVREKGRCAGFVLSGREFL